MALAGGVTLPKSLEFVRAAREQGLTVPVVLMGYYNPFRAFGEKNIVQCAKEAGAASLPREAMLSLLSNSAFASSFSSPSFLPFSVLSLATGNGRTNQDRVAA